MPRQQQQRRRREAAAVAVAETAVDAARCGRVVRKRLSYSLVTVCFGHVRYAQVSWRVSFLAYRCARVLSFVTHVNEDVNNRPFLSTVASPPMQTSCKIRHERAEQFLLSNFSMWMQVKRTTAIHGSNNNTYQRVKNKVSGQSPLAPPLSKAAGGIVKCLTYLGDMSPIGLLLTAVGVVKFSLPAVWRFNCNFLSYTFRIPGDCFVNGN